MGLTLEELLLEAGLEIVRQDNIIKSFRSTGWIKIKDKLPENNQIVVIEWDDNPWFPTVAKFVSDQKQFIIPFRPNRDYNQVSYWTPLPKIPNETSTDI